mmetsp:Transcript_75656/g.169675  ORF Transcript_75656/g.169675 Transcript_75656/m.169675 type:complete len:217 (+) Transcript_75656:2-652(+)
MPAVARRFPNWRRPLQAGTALGMIPFLAGTRRTHAPFIRKVSRSLSRRARTQAADHVLGGEVPTLWVPCLATGSPPRSTRPKRSLSTSSMTPAKAMSLASGRLAAGWPCLSAHVTVVGVWRSSASTAAAAGRSRRSLGRCDALVFTRTLCDSWRATRAVRARMSWCSNIATAPPCTTSTRKSTPTVDYLSGLSHDSYASCSLGWSTSVPVVWTTRM